MSFNSSLEKVKINLLIFINNNSGGNKVLKELTKLPYIELIILEKNKINKFKLLFKIFKHYYYLRKFKNRIILCSDPILSIILFYSKINFIRFVQGDDLILFNQRVPTFINFIYKKLYKNSLRQKTIVNSDFTKDNLIKVNSKINIIGKCRPGGNFKLIHKHRKYEIVYIYRDAPWKGSEDFFDIIKSLDNLLVTEINILLINYDKSKLPKKFNKIKFDMLPWINKSELNLKFCMSKIILSTTENEGFGMPFLEAMQSGCIAITPQVGGTSDFLKDNYTGFTYKKEKNKENVIKKILYVINNYNKKNIKKIINNSLKYSQKFNWDNTRKEFESIYKKKLLN